MNSAPFYWEGSDITVRLSNHFSLAGNEQDQCRCRRSLSFGRLAEFHLNWDIAKMMHFFNRLISTCLGICLVTGSLSAAELPEIPLTGLVAPFEGKPSYPFNKDDSISCGQWGKSSQDYPYFGAPRGHDRRRHAGVDLYPEGGDGTSVKALADGIIIKIAPFYTRTNGEVTYGVLVDHADFVANYAELNKPGFEVSSTIKQGQIIGTISGTKQLHFEMYTKGTKDWLRWYGKQPDDLNDPTEMLIELFKK